MSKMQMTRTGALRCLTAPVYAILWLLAWGIVIPIATAVEIDFLLRPTRRVHVPEGKDPQELADTLQRYRIGAAVDGRYVRVPARDAELAREWVVHLQKYGMLRAHSRAARRCAVIRAVHQHQPISRKATTMGIHSRPTPTRTVYGVIHDGAVLYKALNRQAAEAFTDGWKAAGGAETKIATSTETVEPLGR